MTASPIEVAIVGAGFSGIAMARALDRAGISDYLLLEKADEVGGTWRENVYPGAACDVPSHLYSLSDAPRSTWTRLFPQQPEILAYLRELAVPLMAGGRLRLGACLQRAQWLGETACWELELGDGSTLQARQLVLALGGLHVPAWPDIPGREQFAGRSLHTARWDEAVDLAGNRVGVIGTGASAVQVVPAIVDRVAELHVFQRSPGWVLPRNDFAIRPWLQGLLAHIPGLRLALRGGIFLLLELLAQGLLRPATAFWARALARRHLHRQVADPALRERLTPDYPIGCKRVLISSDWYPALCRPHCHLVDTPIAAITPTGLRLADGRGIALDVLVYATGFRPVDSVAAIEIVGENGQRLAEAWRERPAAYLGIGVAGFPNLALLLGPNTALGHNSVLYMIESQVRHVLAQIRARRERGAAWCAPRAEAQAAFLDRLDTRLAGTAWTGGCRSWYLDGQGRNIALWVGPAMAYRWRTRKVDPADYRYG